MGRDGVPRRADWHEHRPHRDDVSVDHAADVLWMLTSFESFELLYTGRSVPADEVASTLAATAERTLCR